MRPSHSRRYAEALQNLDVPAAVDLVVNAVIADNARRAMRSDVPLEEHDADATADHLQLMSCIESQLDA